MRFPLRRSPPNQPSREDQPPCEASKPRSEAPETTGARTDTRRPSPLNRKTPSHIASALPPRAATGRPATHHPAPLRGPPRIPQPHGNRPPQSHASPPWATPQQPNRTNSTASARANRNYLRALYSTLKYCDQHIRFSFITGVSKFSKVSLFSSLNNLNDLTLDPRYASICGYTDHHLDTVFAPELNGLDRDRIREWYNGYS